MNMARGPPHKTGTSVGVGVMVGVGVCVIVGVSVTEAVGVPVAGLSPLNAPQLTIPGRIKRQESNRVIRLNV